jgi:hypothetical protein
LRGRPRARARRRARLGGTAAHRLGGIRRRRVPRRHGVGGRALRARSRGREQGTPRMG